MSNYRAISRESYKDVPLRAKVLAALFAAFLAAFAAFAEAEVFVMEDQAGSRVRLFDEPCSVVSGWLKMRRAEMFYQGKIYEGCWIVILPYVLVFDEAGDVTPILRTAFRKERVI